MPTCSPARRIRVSEEAREYFALVMPAQAGIQTFFIRLGPGLRRGDD